MALFKKPNLGDLVAVLVGLALILLSLALMSGAPATQISARTTDGTIVQTEYYWLRKYFIVEFPSRREMFRFRLESIYPGQYTVGQSVRVVYDGDDPENASLDTFWTRTGRFWFGLIFGAAMMLYGIAAPFRSFGQRNAKRTHRTKPAYTKPEETKRTANKKKITVRKTKKVAKKAKKKAARKKKTGSNQARRPSIPPRIWTWKLNRKKFEVSILHGKLHWVEFAPGDYWAGGGYGAGQTYRGFIKNGPPDFVRVPTRIAAQLRRYILKHRPELGSGPGSPPQVDRS